MRVYAAHFPSFISELWTEQPAKATYHEKNIEAFLALPVFVRKQGLSIDDIKNHIPITRFQILYI